MYALSEQLEAAPRCRADLRSDTVTQPTSGMLGAMAAAALGDDVYGDDPTVNRLEGAAAERLGKEAALFCPSGTQSNLLAMLSWCGRGEEVITGRAYHTYSYEARGASVLGGVALEPLETAADGGLDPAAITAAVKPDDSHLPVSRLLSLENTVSGAVVPMARMREAADAGRAEGLAVHLDGARLMNAAVALGVEAAEIAAAADSVSLCLSKGLGAPVGSVLAGPRAFIDKARRTRKMLGGGMRQAGGLAAAGLYALEHQAERLAEDHGRAARLAQRLSSFDAVAVRATPTNMVFVTPREEDHAPLLTALAEAGVRINPSKPTLRMVFHLDVDDQALEAVFEAFERVYGR
ncbi:MAG: low-specificity L-threonine aldolase [Pseudomonadota bacterium]